MNKFSVIIPTLRRCVDVTNEFLYNMYEDEAVDEVIIIDNAHSDDANTQLLMYPKTVYITPEENIYVNPAWNLGVSKARNENIILGSDDIYVPYGIVSMLANIDLKPLGVLGIPRETIYPEQSDHSLFFDTLEVRETAMRNWGFGVFMALHKDNYYPLPDDIKVWCGDDAIFHMNLKAGRKNGLMFFPVRTKMSTTSDEPMFDAIKQNDLVLWERYKFENGIFNQ